MYTCTQFCQYSLFLVFPAGAFAINQYSLFLPCFFIFLFAFSVCSQFIIRHKFCFFTLASYNDYNISRLCYRSVPIPFLYSYPLIFPLRCLLTMISTESLILDFVHDFLIPHSVVLLTKSAWNFSPLPPLSSSLHVYIYRVFSICFY